MVLHIRTNDVSLSYLPLLDHWETKGMKIVKSVALYKDNILVYLWGIDPSQDLSDINIYPYKESGFRKTLLGKFPIEYDNVIMETF
jgi:hypothetical protein